MAGGEGERAPLDTLGEGGPAITLRVETVGGRTLELAVAPELALSELRVQICGELGAPMGSTQLLLDGEVLADDGTRTLAERGIVSGTSLSAVILNTVVVRRHFYKAEFGPPPLPGSWYVRQENMELKPTVRLEDQRDELLVGIRDVRVTPMGAGMGRRFMHPKEPQLWTVRRPSDVEVLPREWKEDGAERLDLQKTAAEVFGSGDLDLVVVCPSPFRR